jgi:hypothetical protein
MCCKETFPGYSKSLRTEENNASALSYRDERPVERSSSRFNM